MAMTARSRYEQLKPRREPFLLRAREFSKLTLPSLYPSEGMRNGEYQFEAYQGLGARGVINLSSRLLLALLPAGQSLFRFTVPPEVLVKTEDMSIPKDIELGFTKAERLVSSEIERSGWRQPTNLLLQLMMVGGSAAEYLTPENTLRIFRLDQFVVVRDTAGNLTEAVLEEKVSPLALPPELQKSIPPKLLEDPTAQVEVYTWLTLGPSGVWKRHQEILDKRIAGTEGTYKVNPYNFYRWSWIPEEDYGRGKIEEHYADLRSLEGLEKAVLEGSAMAARNIITVRPNATGGNLKQRITKARNGDVIIANPEDLSMLRFDNVAGMQIVSQHLTVKTQEVAAAFLLNSAMRRDAERVTAYELQLMAEELEGTLGGVYSMLSQDMQRSRIQRLLMQMQDSGKLPEWPEGTVEPVITTGLEALGRQRDLVRVKTAGEFVASLGPEAQEYVKLPVLLARAFAALEMPDAIRTDEEVSARHQQREMAAAAATSAGNVATAAGEAALATPQESPSPSPV